MREKISAALLSFVFLISLFLVVPALMATSDSELIEQLIKSNGKSTIISIIRKHRQNNITVIVDGQLQESFGPPDEKYVTAKTILEDLKKMRLSLAEFNKMVAQKTTTGTQVAAEKKNAEQKTLTETPSKAEIPHDKAVALFLAGQYDEALDHANESLTQAEIRFGKDSIELSKPLSLLADIQLNRKRYQEAADHLEQLRVIQEDTLGNSNGQVVNTMTRLIEVYEKLGDNAKANGLNELADSRWGGGSQKGNRISANVLSNQRNSGEVEGWDRTAWGMTENDIFKIYGHGASKDMRINALVYGSSLFTDLIINSFSAYGRQFHVSLFMSEKGRRLRMVNLEFDHDCKEVFQNGIPGSDETYSSLLKLMIDQYGNPIKSNSIKKDNSSELDMSSLWLFSKTKIELTSTCKYFKYSNFTAGHVAITYYDTSILNGHR